MKMKGCGVILFPMPFQGHLNPMLQLASILHERGFSISIIHTHFNSPNPANYPHFGFYPIPDGLPENYVISSDPNLMVSFIKLINSSCQIPLRDCLAKLMSTGSEDEDPVACFVSDVLWYNTQAVADELRLPRIALRTSNVLSFLVLASMPSLFQKGYLPLQDSEAEMEVPELPQFKLKDISMFKATDPGSFLEFMDMVVQETKASSGIIYNSCEDLEEEYLKKFSLSFPIPTFLIGPFHKYFPASSSSLLPQDMTCVSWLDKQQPKSVIYVSFGSVAAITEMDFLEVAWGLANSKQPFLWVVRPGLVQGAEWLEPLPNGFPEMVGERGQIVKWAPQQEVLVHPATGAFWTHCGWNSTLESLCEGVPMICQPSFGD
ncbi:UDP-glycosyltransferase 76C2 [Hibiscus syriacus]|uniref:UDP-glycosyltransferase 76C2 n=1 Tax=Hibiscus syriacus TaxID=106335 RepID=A0A6A2YRY6_HIBSY|nr:UDP-glycosyltransferase 76C2 [Hibiscus syriacus]